jgi:5-hydroxyisourate hydrolase
MSAITTHVLDTVLGKPAAGVSVRLDRLKLDSLKAGRWTHMSHSITDADGRCGDLAANAPPATYRLTFDTSAYLARLGRTTIYPEITIVFHCTSEPHYHMPLLLSDNSYTTYRGS